MSQLDYLAGLARRAKYIEVPRKELERLKRIEARELERLKRIEERLKAEREKWGANHAEAPLGTIYRQMCAHTADALDNVARDD